MVDLEEIREDKPIYALRGASDVHIGTVDKVEGGKYIKLTKTSAADGQHHWFPIDWVRAVDERAVYLNKTVDEVSEQLMNEQPV
ncbi:hypothetical protein NIES4071_65180 [Calothrix sp. NIES-4071]|nr:hypothetical protein NIES4071_65180 [Calothrix sp. NIES-4071]BAZ60822.1 hypothetical protein NIES4105_65140 [Calothrix sp. NIES-4105]